MLTDRQQKNEAQLAARTGGVKVEVLVDGLLDLRDLIMRGKRCVTDSGPAVKPVIELAVVHILDDAATALEALSPAPEAQQEPHEVLHVYDGDGGVIIRENGNISTFGALTPAVLAAFEPADTPEAQQEPVARSAEQAVTEAMVEAAQRIRDVAMRQTIAARLPECGEFGGIAQDADWLVDALKAAMEAGR